MLLISHRGNLTAIAPELENTPAYIQNAIDLGYDVELDVWYNNGFFLGHDKPEYPIDFQWLYARKSNLWVHTKNFAALRELIDMDLRVFFHEKEKHTIINNCNIIWSHNLAEADEKSIIPLLSLEALKGYDRKPVYGICSDFVSHFRKDLV